MGVILDIIMWAFLIIVGLAIFVPIIINIVNKVNETQEINVPKKQYSNQTQNVFAKKNERQYSKTEYEMEKYIANAKPVSLLSPYDQKLYEERIEKSFNDSVLRALDQIETDFNTNEINQLTVNVILIHVSDTYKFFIEDEDFYKLIHKDLHVKTVKKIRDKVLDKLGIKL